MTAKEKKQKSIEETLWDAANKLRGTVEPAEYKHVVLALIFLKFVSDTFEEHRQILIDKGRDEFLDMPEFYTSQNVFYLPEHTRWNYIIKNSKQPDIALKIDTALHDIEKNNAALKGALPDNYFSRLGMDITKLSALLDTIGNIDTTTNKNNDLVGRVYEYFLSKFALSEGKGKGEFYTPKCIVNLIAEMIEPYRGKIYDPCCGSGGMFVQSFLFVKSHKGNTRDVAIFGQELTTTTYKLAKMNLAVRGMTANLGEQAADTFARDQHPDLKADFIMANPPFNLKDWRGDGELVDDARWSGYALPPASNANYAWILHMASKLSQDGVSGFLLANGALSGSGEEYKIRRRLIENDLVEAIVTIPRNVFYTTDISVTLWILNRNKEERTVKTADFDRKYRNRKNEILFMDLRKWGSEFEKKFIQLTADDISKVATNYHNWQTGSSEYKDIPEFCKSATLSSIKKNDYSLVPSKYIEFIDADLNIDFATEMMKIQRDFKQIIKDEAESKKTLVEAFEVLGYGVEVE